jgi:hypothetical protein
MFGQVIGALEAGSNALHVAQGLTAAMGVAGTLGSLVQSSHAQEALEDYADTQHAMQVAEDKRRRQQMNRESRIKQARIENVAAQTGTAGSAGAIGSASSIATQTASNLAFLSQTQQLADEASMYGQHAAEARSRAQTDSALANIGLKYGDFGAISRL